MYSTFLYLSSENCVGLRLNSIYNKIKPSPDVSTSGRVVRVIASHSEVLSSNPRGGGNENIKGWSLSQNILKNFITFI